MPSRPSAYDLDGELDVTINTNDMYTSSINDQRHPLGTSPGLSAIRPSPGPSSGPSAVRASPVLLRSPGLSAVKASPIPVRSPSPPQVKGVLSSTNNTPLNNQPQVTRLIHCERPFDGRGVMSYIGTTPHTLASTKTTSQYTLALDNKL